MRYSGGMKTLIFALLALMLSGCTTMITKTWHVHPDDMGRFNSDTLRCQQDARAANSLVGGGVYENVVDYCLQKAGYRLEVSSGG